MPRDHAARYRREEAIAGAASRTRKLGGVDESVNFNIVDFTRGVLFRLNEKSDIQFFDRIDPTAPPAYVRMRKGKTNEIGEIELHVDRGTWSRAQIGFPDDRYIIAHEIGHIILHKDEISFFSDASLVDIKYLPEEERAEWQARKFARHVLLPNDFVERFDYKVEVISHFCNVPIRMAQDAVAEINDLRRRRLIILYSGEICSECGNFTLMRNGKHIHCDTCGNQSSEYVANNG